MREIRQSGSEGGGANHSPYPYMRAGKLMIKTRHSKPMSYICRIAPRSVETLSLSDAPIAELVENLFAIL